MKPRILLVHNGLTRFVEIDRDLLARSYAVTERYERTRSGVRPRDILRAVRSHDLVFCWFASWHAVMPILMARRAGKPALLVVGGYDVANMPEIDYGHQRSGLKKRMSRWCMRQATCLLTISRYSQEEAARASGIGAEQIEMVYIGIPDDFGGMAARSGPPIVLTVGNVDHPNRFRKGHEPFVRAAALIPEAKFMLVGAWKDDAIAYLRGIATPNVTFLGRVEQARLQAAYQQAAVYVQASAHEGFGLSVAEAMLAGCIPAVTRAGALPEVVGPTGVYADAAASQALACAIRAALEAPQSLRAQARQRVLSCFSLEQRHVGLVEIVDRLVSGGIAVAERRKAA